MKNLANWDRYARVVASLALLVAAVAAPMALSLRLPLLLGMAGYMMTTALVGTCLGYKLMGVSTCPVKRAT